MNTKQKQPVNKDSQNTDEPAHDSTHAEQTAEIGGTKGPEPTRYGDWEHNGRCTDF